MRVDDLADEVEVTYFNLRAAFATLDERAATSEPVVGHWTARDVLLHLSAWEARRADAVRTWPLRDETAVPPVSDVDAFNQANAEATARVSWRDALARAADVHRRLVVELRLRHDGDLERVGEPLIAGGVPIPLETLIRNGLRHSTGHQADVQKALSGAS